MKKGHKLLPGKFFMLKLRSTVDFRRDYSSRKSIKGINEVQRKAILRQNLAKSTLTKKQYVEIP